jgi:transcriptional regulator with XRE-family HTH domain
VVKANVRGDSLVKAWREYLGMTQAELAAKAGIKQPALTRIEKIDANPRKTTLIRLAEAMGLTVEQLIE